MSLWVFIAKSQRYLALNVVLPKIGFLVSFLGLQNSKRCFQFIDNGWCSPLFCIKQLWRLTYGSPGTFWLVMFSAFGSVSWYISDEYLSCFQRLLTGISSAQNRLASHQVLRCVSIKLLMEGCYSKRGEGTVNFMKSSCPLYVEYVRWLYIVFCILMHSCSDYIYTKYNKTGITGCCTAHMTSETNGFELMLWVYVCMGTVINWFIDSSMGCFF